MGSKNLSELKSLLSHTNLVSYNKSLYSTGNQMFLSIKKKKKKKTSYKYNVPQLNKASAAFLPNYIINHFPKIHAHPSHMHPARLHASIDFPSTLSPSLRNGNHTHATHANP